MALQFRRGTAAEVSSNTFAPAIGEPLYVTDEQRLYIGDGITEKGNAIGGVNDIDQLTSVNLITESIGTISSYSVSRNVATVTLALAKGYSVGLSVTIADTTVSALNTTHVITAIPAANQFSFALTTADVANTTITGTVTPSIPDGDVLYWDNGAGNWKNKSLELGELADVDLTTTAPVSGNVLQYNGTNFVAGTLISDIVDDTTPQLGGDLDTNGNDIVSIGTNDVSFDPATGQNVVIKGNATDGSGRIVLNCESNTHGVTLKGPPHSAAATYTLTLPDAVATASGQALTSDTSGNLSFTNVGAATRATGSATTASIADGASADITISSAAKTYMLMSIQTSAAAWVTVYTSTAARTADASRTVNTDPLPGSGVIAEVVTGAATTQKITPGLLGFNDESTPTSDIYLKVENQSGSAAAITVTLSFVTLEG